MGSRLTPGLTARLMKEEENGVSLRQKNAHADVV